MCIHAHTHTHYERKSKQRHTCLFNNSIFLDCTYLAKCPVLPHLLHRSNSSLIFASASAYSSSFKNSFLVQNFHPRTLSIPRTYICLSVSSLSGPSPSPSRVPNLARSFPVGGYFFVKLLPTPAKCWLVRPAHIL